MHPRRDADGVERPLVQRMTQRGGAAEILILLIHHELVVARQRLLKGGVLHIELHRQLAYGRRADNKALGDILIGRFVVRPHLFVEDHPGAFLRQRDNLRGNLVAGLHLIKEAFALLRHQDSAAAANRFRDQIRRGLLDGGMDLDFAHIDRIRPQLLQHGDAAAGRPFVVGGHEAVQLRTVFHHHLAVGAEAAGRDDYAFRIEDAAVVVLIHYLHAGYRAVLGENFSDRGIQQHLDITLVDVFHQAADQVAANR